jgi:hypothetical protein
LESAVQESGNEEIAARDLLLLIFGEQLSFNCARVRRAPVVELNKDV